MPSALAACQPCSSRTVPRAAPRAPPAARTPLGAPPPPLAHSHRRPARCAAARVFGQGNGRGESGSYVRVPVEAFSSAKVHDNADPSLSLDRYMRMPLEEFAQLQLPLGAKMTLAGNDHLELVVPDMRIFDLKISPHVLLRAERIEGDHPALVMHVEKFELQGSQAIIRALNEAVTVVGSTKFSWQSAGKDSHVYCSTNLELGGEPPGPFKLVPKGLLESTIATGMGSTVGLIQKPFMNRIADDFKRWASDPSFRGARAATGAGVRSQMALVGVGKSRGRDVRLGARSRKHEEA